MTKVQSGIFMHIDWQIKVVQVINIFSIRYIYLLEIESDKILSGT